MLLHRTIEGSNRRQMPSRRLVRLWRSAGLTIRSGVQPGHIQAFESKYGVVLPADLREYFLTVDGMEDELDQGTNRFWPLANVRPVEDELPKAHSDRFEYPGCFVFVDHCVWCWAWAVQIGKSSSAESGPVFQVSAGEAHPRQVAPSFSSFLRMYLVDQWSIQ